MTAAEIHAKMSKDGDPRAYAPRARQTPATVLCNINYFSIFWKVAKTYHEAQLIGRMFSPHQPAVRSLSDIMVRFVPTSVRESFQQKEPQSSVTRYPAQPTCTVYEPSSVRCRDIFSANTVSLPPQATDRSLQYKTFDRARYAIRVDSSTSRSVAYSELPQKLSAERADVSQYKEASFR